MPTQDSTQLDQNTTQNMGQTEAPAQQPPATAQQQAPAAQPAPEQGATTPANPQKPVDSPAKKTGRTVLILLVILLLLAGAGFWYWRSTFTSDTDDAQVDGNIYQVSSRIAGSVIAVHVQDNTSVKKGDLLVEVDPKDYQVALEQAQATLAQAQADYTQANVNVPITSTSTSTTLQNAGVDIRATGTGVVQAQQTAAANAARVDEAKANAIKAIKDVERYTPLVEKDVISRQQYDAAVAAASSANAQVLEAENQLVAQESAVTAAQQRLETSRNQAAEARKNGPEQVAAQRAKATSALANVRQAQARVDQALLNLSYTRVVAPTDGIVNKKNIEVGGNLAVGQDLLTIVPLNDLWVTANFKETQLKGMKEPDPAHHQPGSHVDLKVDALGGRHFTGEVVQIGGATGSRLSLFPPENATGNYVKVVQRIPVRINFTNLDKENSDHALRAGFSVTPDVDIK